MRQLSSDILTHLNTQYGQEPVTAIRIHWSPTDVVTYSDKADVLQNILGQILDLSPLDDIVTTNGSNKSISFILDDTDGKILQRFNNTDFYRLKVEVLQWFWGMSINSAAVLFTGFINTPIGWSEGNRNISITVLSRLDDAEFGAQMGLAGINPGALYDRLEGIQIPYVVGNVYRYPGTMFSEPSRGVILRGFTYLFEEQIRADLADLLAQLNKAINNATYCFKAGDSVDAAASLAELSGDTEAAAQLRSERDQWYRQYNQYSNEVIALGQDTTKLELDVQKARRYSYETSPLYIYTEHTRTTTPLPGADTSGYLVEIAGDIFQATYTNTNLQIIRLSPFTARAGQSYISRVYDQNVVRIAESRSGGQRYKWYDAGTAFRDVSGRIKYFFGLNCLVSAVYAKVKGLKTLLNPALYTIEAIPIVNVSNEFVANISVVSVPVLSSILNAGGEPLYDSDEIWADLVSTDQTLTDVITTAVHYSAHLQIDIESFNTQVGPASGRQLSGVHTAQTGVIQFIRDVCYQNRIAVWIDGDTLKFRNLAFKPTAVDEITQDDVDEKTLEIGLTDTDSLVTRYTGLYKPRWDEPESSKVIFRYNVPKYGVRDKSYDFWLFGNQDAVYQSAGYWCVYEGTCWKTLRMKVVSNKLTLESQDPVLLKGFNKLFSNHDVVGIVQTAVYNSSDNTIDMTVWLPIRAGEMDEFEFAYPGNADSVAFDKYTGDFLTGSPFFQTRFQTLQPPFTYIPTYGNISTPRPFFGADYSPAVPSIVPVTVGLYDPQQPPGLKTINDKDRKEILDPIAPISVAVKDGVSRLAVVRDFVSGSTYKMEYAPGKFVNATQGQLAVDEIIPNGTYAIILKQGGKWYMQVPVWLSDPPDA